MIELLAPAGNFDALKAAVNAGANAVYLAGSNFGARAYADNFNRENLAAAVPGAPLLFGGDYFDRTSGSRR